MNRGEEVVGIGHLVDAIEPIIEDQGIFHVSAEVLRVQVAGHGILGDLAGPVFQFLGEARSFCVKQPCICPDGSKPLDDLAALSPDARLAVTGDATSTSRAQLTGFSMDDLCGETWDGTWQSTAIQSPGRSSCTTP
jgi:hypothetical protein